MSEVKIGDTLYRFDQNRRRYRAGPDGRSSGPPIYSEHFEPLVITGETKQSWLCREGYGDAKVNKKTLRESNGGFAYSWFTKAQMEDNIWRHEHRHRIREMLDRADAATLRRVAEAIGYSP